MLDKFKITVKLSKEFDTSNTIVNNLREYNNSKYQIKNFCNIELTVEDGDELIGGLKGKVNFDWLFISDFWVNENERGAGLGRKVLLKAEEIASDRNCYGVHLDTYSFQGPGFYQKCGYEVFGEISDHPVGHSRYFFKKKLKK